MKSIAYLIFGFSTFLCSSTTAFLIHNPYCPSHAGAANTAGTRRFASPDSLKKAELIESIASKSGFSKKDSEMALTAVLDTIIEEVNGGKKVPLPGFGSFVLKERSARKGRNPQTGEEIQIKASKSPGFTPSKAWKDSLKAEK